MQLQAADTLGAAAGAIHDTLTPPPLPGGVATLFRFLFQVPQWIQIAGAAVGLAVVAFVLVLIWRRRLGILTWLRTRTRQVQTTLALGLLLVIAVAALAGMKSWDYMQHDNGFCTGCHIMETPFQRFATGAGKHQNLKCHDCHQQSLFASMRQLVLWVAERPEKIGMHAPVPNARCESCHQKGIGMVGGRERWEHVLRLAGHRVHFESDSSALAGLACVKCHGAEVHRFIPSTRTCQQSGCHEQQPVRLSHMAKLPEISCVTCHNFTADIPGLATRDSAVRALVPSREQCQSCHAMLAKPPGYVAARDPHHGSCGSCHDVHTDVVPADARGSCQKCHTNVAQNAFHSGANHRRIQDQCLTCHQPHAASVDPSDCVGCHQDVRRRGLFHPPVPFDTGAVLRHRPPAVGAATQDASWSYRHQARGPSADEEEISTDLPPVRASPAPVTAVPADSFSHARHKSLPCLTCHVVNRPGAGLVFQVPRGCDLCHHQRIVAGKVEPQDCTRCHQPETINAAKEEEVRVAAGSRPATARLVPFRHDRHERLACADCHRPPSAAPPDSVRTCTACHDQHHAEGRDCGTCHNREETAPAHRRSDHLNCAACHQAATIAELVPTRTFCLTCHAKERDHQPGDECTTCHFLETPAQFRRHLVGGPGR